MPSLILNNYCRLSRHISAKTLCTDHFQFLQKTVSYKTELNSVQSRKTTVILHFTVYQARQVYNLILPQAHEGPFLCSVSEIARVDVILIINRNISPGDVSQTRLLVSSLQPSESTENRRFCLSIQTGNKFYFCKKRAILCRFKI